MTKDELQEKISVLLSCKKCPENKGGYICKEEYENKCLAQKIQYIKELQEENAELDMKRKAERKIFQGIVEKKNDQRTKAKEILQTVFDKWKEERWILQSEKEVKQIENLMKQAEQFIKEIEK